MAVSNLPGTSTMKYMGAKNWKLKNDENKEESLEIKKTLET